MNRGFALTIGILAMLAPAGARAQTNLDRGKSASQLFAGSCVECHKAPQSLAKGKSAATIAEFLREHYTTGRDQAAALAAYVASGRGRYRQGSFADVSSQECRQQVQARLHTLLTSCHVLYSVCQRHPPACGNSGNSVTRLPSLKQNPP